MPTILSKGYKIPSNGERDWWQTLADDITRVNNHNHDGANSEKITASNVTKIETTILPSDWIAVGDGTFKQTKTLPALIFFPQVSVRVHVVKEVITGGVPANVAQEEIIGCVSVETTTQYSIYVNDNTLTLKVVYA